MWKRPCFCVKCECLWFLHKLFFDVVFNFSWKDTGINWFPGPAGREVPACLERGASLFGERCQPVVAPDRAGTPQLWWRLLCVSGVTHHSWGEDHFVCSVTHHSCGSYSTMSVVVLVWCIVVVVQAGEEENPCTTSPLGSLHPHPANCSR